MWARPLASLPGYDWEVVPTNPVCESVPHAADAHNRRGEKLSEFPRHAWCKRSDLEKNLLRLDTPESKLLAGINDPETRRIRMTYLSFGNERISAALCAALKRDVPVDLILDSNKAWEVEAELRLCNPEKFTYYSRGNSGEIGFAHNKVTFLEKGRGNEIEIVIGSGNMTLGTILTHDNWHFIKVPVKSHFASLHECLWKGMVHHAADLGQYKSFIENCRNAIVSPAEPGLDVFLIPGDGDRMLSLLKKEFATSQWVRGASHRFNGRLMDQLFSQTLKSGISVGMIFDDDMFWAGDLGRGFGLNQTGEARLVRELSKLGMVTKYIQTNHQEYLIQHNKFFIWGHQSEPMTAAQGVFLGAGNFTTSAFTKNFENFYLVRVPEVVEDMQSYYRHLWEDLASSPEEMPETPSVKSPR